MKKNKILICLMVVLATFLPAFTSNEQAAAATAAETPVVYWDGMLLVKGQVGRLEVLKPINLWKRDANNKLIFSRVLKKGERYRVYNYSPLYGGQYGVGGGYYVTNIPGYLKYETPPKAKLKLLNPEVYGTKLSLGTVKSEVSTVIAPGVTQTDLSVTGTRGDQAIHVLNVDQQAGGIKFETALAKNQMIGLEKVSSIANRNQADEHYVIGAVNGDYFLSNGSPTDLTVVNGDLVTTNTTPKSERTIFGISQAGKAMIGNPEISLTVSVNGQAPYPIDSVNKRRNANNLVLYTPAFSNTTMTNELGTEVILTNISGQLNGNNTVTATVKEVIIGKGSAALQPGEFILSGHALGSDYLKTFTAGDSVQINLSYDDPAWSQVNQAIGGRYHLVSGGVAQSFAIIGAHPRTAVGIKKDGSVFMTVIDGRSENSSGVTLTEIAKVMKDLGAVEAMTFDGGGSSTMVVRKPGDVDASIINSPSDGSERSVSNALLIVGLWKAGPLSTLILKADNLKLVAGATYQNLNISVLGLDKNNNSITVTSPLVWTSNLGVFNKDGSFTVNKTIGKGNITAASGTIKASVAVEVINKLDSIKAINNQLMVEPNGSISIPMEGYVNGKLVVSDPSIFTYTVTGNIGTVDKGIFKAGNVAGEGTIKVSYGSVSTELRVIVGSPKEIVIENFEGDLSTWQASGARYNSVSVSPEKGIVMEGMQSLKIAYDFIGMTGTSGVYASKGPGITIPGTPVKIGMWVYGDGKGHWIRSQLVDAANNVVQLDFSKNVDWTGWKYVEAPIPAGLSAPFKLDIPVRYMEINDANKNNGQIYIDRISAIYN